MKQNIILPAIAKNILDNFTGNTGSKAYSFTKIADTESFFIKFGYVTSINNDGVVAFQAAALLKEGRYGIFTGNGQSITKIADTSGDLKGFACPALNDTGAVAFLASLKTGGKGIFTGDGDHVSKIADTGDRFCWFSGTPAIDNSSNVAFWAALKGGGEGIFMGNGGDITGIADTEGKFKALASPSINAGGNVAFRAALKRGGYGIFMANGDAIAKIADTSKAFSWFAHPCINDAGNVTFLAYPTGGGYGIFKGNGRRITYIAHTSGCLSEFASPSLNDTGAIAFRAKLRAKNEAIFIAAGSNAKKVIAVGDYLFGSQITNLVFSPGGLNNYGQIAFYASFADGTSGIFRADPVAVFSDSDIVTKPVSQQPSNRSQKMSKISLPTACRAKHPVCG